MNHRALIRCVATGEEAWTDEFPGDEPAGTDYIWTEGNYACDCNRRLFFELARGRARPDDYPRGDTAYELVEIRRDDGAVLMFGEEEAKWVR